MRQRRLVIYVAGPLTASCQADVAQNIEDACMAGRRILDLGHFPVIPHLTDFFSESKAGEGLTYEDYMRWDFALIERCDALLYLAPSPGADRERAFAESRGLPIYTSTEEIPRATR